LRVSDVPFPLDEPFLNTLLSFLVADAASSFRKRAYKYKNLDLFSDPLSLSGK